MFGHRFFGARFYGPRYWGPSITVVVTGTLKAVDDLLRAAIAKVDGIQLNQLKGYDDLAP